MDRAIFQDPADRKEASEWCHPIKRSHESGFLEQLVDEYQISKDDQEALLEFIRCETDRIFGEQFVRLLQFFEACKIPKLVVFATLTTNGSMSQVAIAEQCGVSKQAVNKAFRAMEPALKRYGGGFERKRNFKHREVVEIPS